MASWKKVIVSGSAASQLSFAGTGILSGSGAVTAVTDTATIDLTLSSGTISGVVPTGSITQNQLADNSVITAKIGNSQVTNEKLANASVTVGSTAITLGAAATTITGLTSVTSTTFVGDLTGNASTATSASYANLTNVSGDVTITAPGVATIANNAVTTAKINNNAVTTDKIADDNVTNAKLENSAITIAGTSTSLGGTITAATILNGTAVVSSSAEGDNQGQIKLNGVNVNVHDMGADDSPTFTNLTLTGNLAVNGTVTTINTDNLNIEDKFILLNSGSAAADGGLVINGAGSAIGWDQSEGRFALDFSGATFNQTTIASDAFVASVVTTDDANYQKVGNIRISGEDIFIYS